MHSIILRLDWPEDDHPLRKLKSLRTRGWSGGSEAVQFLLPSMTSLQIANSEYVSASVLHSLVIPLPLPIRIPPALRTLIIKRSGLNVEMLETILSSPWLRELRTLRVRRCSDHPQDMSLLLRILEKHIPRLECLEVSGCFPGDAIDESDTFAGMKHLVDLHVDLCLIVPSTDETLETLRRNRKFFPDSLRSLHLDSIPVGRIEDIVATSLKQTEQGDTTAAMDRILPIPHIKAFTLSLDFERKNSYEEGAVGLLELNPQTVAFLQSAAADLSTIGKTLKVNHAPRRYTRFYKYIVGADWVAPLPHSRRERDYGGAIPDSPWDVGP